MDDFSLVSGKDTSHKVKENEVYFHGYQEGLKLKKTELLE
jgi:hypothetical protein